MSEFDDRNLVNNTATAVPGIYDLNSEDSAFVIVSAVLIFTLTTGFAFLEAGCVSKKNEVNIMMKTLIDVIIGGFAYWLFGFAFSYGMSQYSNPFIGIGNFLVDPSIGERYFGPTFTLFFFQLSFATTATTIVSGAMAERCNFKAYCVFAFLNIITYSIAAGWVWGDHGFLKKLGAVDIAGSGPIHLVGGASALMAAIMLGPRLGRYDQGADAPPLGSPTNVIIGFFVIWFAWFAFNSGSTYGVSDKKWYYAGRGAVTTMMSSVGGGLFGLFFALATSRGQTVDIVIVINAILGALVSITAGCFLFTVWESVIIGIIGGALTSLTAPLFDKLRIDDPVGAVSVHCIGGIWGVFCVGLFASNPVPLDTTGGRSGVFRGGGWYLLGIQSLTCVCLVVWSLLATFIILWILNKIVPIRMTPYEELLGADLTEHKIRHAMAGVSRALTALRPINPHTDLETIPKAGINPNLERETNALYNWTRYNKNTAPRKVVSSSKNMFRNNRFVRRFMRKTPVPETVTVTNNNKNVSSALNMFSSVPRNGDERPPYAWMD